MQPGSYAAVTLDLIRQSAQSGAATRLCVSGTSMLPLLRPGDAVWLESVDPAMLRRGDLVVIWQNGVLLTHRLIAAGAGCWQTKGDNNWLADPPIAAEAIQGRIVTLERGGALISMRKRRWLLANRLLGQASSLESRLYEGEHSSQSRRGRLAYVQNVAFRLLIWLIVRVALC